MNKAMRTLLQACNLYDAVVDLKTWLTRSQAQHVKFYSQFVKEGDLCFDVGANMGRRTKALLKLGASVVAIEPLPYCMKALKKKFAHNDKVVLVQKALGESTGQAEMKISESHSVSSISQDWIESVKSSGRHHGCTWNQTVTVPVTTLDDLIAECGRPAFIKIDVEGYEYEVLKGLSQPVRVISLEFTPEFIDSGVNSVRRLSEIGPVKLNYSFADKSPVLELEAWVGSEQMCEILAALSRQKRAGDVYAGFDV
ncbi:MAG: FkbM family methyltransferase [Planctomycetota bacterium]|jgi:FkbM family methyltransferase